MKYTAIEKTYKDCNIIVKRYEDNVISLDVYECGDEYEKCIFTMDLNDEVILILFFIVSIDGSYLAEMIEDMYNEIKQ